MKIEWNKVTWYSKLLALILFIALPFLGFYFGVKYEKVKEEVAQTNVPSVNISSSNVSGNDVTAGWKTYRNEEYGFEIKYPKEYTLSDYYSDYKLTRDKINNTNYAIDLIQITDPSVNDVVGPLLGVSVQLHPSPSRGKVFTNVEDYVNSLSLASAAEDDFIKIKIGSYDAIEIIPKSENVNRENYDYTADGSSIYVLKDGIMFGISFNFYPLFKEIASTFKFIP